MNTDCFCRIMLRQAQRYGTQRAEWQQKGGANTDASVSLQGQNPTQAGIATRYTGKAR